jgi:MazG family protein
MAAPGSSLSRLVEIMDRLLAPDGCPWDREQTLASLRPFLVEETYEVLDALERDHVEDHREELGDLLMQVVFQAALRQAEGAFGIDDVVAEICDKLVRRHPHIFGAPGASTCRTSAEVLTQWEQIKAAEKAKKAAAAARTLGGVLKQLPALGRAQKLGAKAGKVGFDWGGWQGSLAKVREEVDEVTEIADVGGRRRAPRDRRPAVRGGQPGPQARGRRRVGAARRLAPLHSAVRVHRGPARRGRPPPGRLEPRGDGRAVERREGRRRRRPRLSEMCKFFEHARRKSREHWRSGPARGHSHAGCPQARRDTVAAARPTDVRSTTPLDSAATGALLTGAR